MDRVHTSWPPQFNSAILGSHKQYYCPQWNHWKLIPVLWSVDQHLMDSPLHYLFLECPSAYFERKEIVSTFIKERHKFPERFLTLISALEHNAKWFINFWLNLRVSAEDNDLPCQTIHQRINYRSISDFYQPDPIRIKTVSQANRRENLLASPRLWGSTNYYLSIIWWSGILTK